MAFVMREDELRAFPELGKPFEQAVPDLGVAPHLLLLALGERPRLQQDEVVRADLADVVHANGVTDELDLRALEPETLCQSLGEVRNALAVAVGVWVAQVDYVSKLEDRGLGLLSYSVA